MRPPTGPPTGPPPDRRAQARQRPKTPVRASWRRAPRQSAFRQTVCLQSAFRQTVCLQSAFRQTVCLQSGFRQTVCLQSAFRQTVCLRPAWCPQRWRPRPSPWRPSRQSPSRWRPRRQDHRSHYRLQTRPPVLRQRPARPGRPPVDRPPVDRPPVDRPPVDQPPEPAGRGRSHHPPPGHAAPRPRGAFLAGTTVGRRYPCPSRGSPGPRHRRIPTPPGQGPDRATTARARRG